MDSNLVIEMQEPNVLVDGQTYNYFCNNLSQIYIISNFDPGPKPLCLEPYYLQLVLELLDLLYFLHILSLDSRTTIMDISPINLVIIVIRYFADPFLVHLT